MKYGLVYLRLCQRPCPQQNPPRDMVLIHRTESARIMTIETVVSHAEIFVVFEYDGKGRIAAGRECRDGRLQIGAFVQNESFGMSLVTNDHMTVLDFHRLARKPDDPFDEKLIGARRKRRMENHNLLPIQLLGWIDGKEMRSKNTDIRLLITELAYDQILPILEIRLHTRSLHEEGLEKKHANRYNDNEGKRADFDYLPQKKPYAVHILVGIRRIFRNTLIHTGVTLKKN